MFIMSSRGPENFLLYITARIRTFLKPGTVRVRKNFIRIRTWGYVPSNNFMTCESRSADPDVRIVIKFLMTTRGSGSTDPGVGFAQKILLHDDARIRGVWIRALEPLKKILLHVDARIRGVRILASMRF